MILTILGVEDIVISINKMDNAKLKVCLKWLGKKIVIIIWKYIILNLFIWILDDYIKVQHSNCASSQRFNAINDAKVACSSNVRCIGVLEENCDSSSMYYLCQEDMKKDVEAISCVHKKRETIGLFSSHHQDYLYYSRSIYLQYW